MKYDIFISYRREGGYDTAKHLNDLLVRDGYRVSFDIDTLRNGNFDTQLLTRIEECQDFILIVDGNAFDRTLDPTFDRDKDWLRCELAHALKHNKNIIPIFLAGVTGFPDGLPDDIADVVKKNAPEYNRYYFDAFYDKLKKDLVTLKESDNKIKGAEIALYHIADATKDGYNLDFSLRGEITNCNVSLDDLTGDSTFEYLGGNNRENEITIISSVENVIVTCNKIQASQEYKGGKNSPKFALFGYENGNNSIFGGNNTFLGWYENAEELKKEIVAIKEMRKHIAAYIKNMKEAAEILREDKSC